MSFEFNEENQGFDPSLQFQSKNPPMVQFIIDIGLAKDAKSANILLMIIAVIFFVVSIFLFARVFGGPSTPNNPPVSDFPFDPGNPTLRNQ